MALQEDFENAGNWLFRWRSYLPLLVTAIFLLALLDYQYPGGSDVTQAVWEVFCLLVSLLGLGIRAFTVGHTPYGTSGRNTQKQMAESLNTTGLYSIVRNPLYLGNFFMGFGVSLFACLWWLGLIYILIFWLYHERIIYAEESFLRGKFGDAYMEWANQTPVIIPKLRGYTKPALSFSLKTVLSREANSYFAVIVLMCILDSVSNMVVTGHGYLSVGWSYLLAASFVLWLILRVLKKYTRILMVEGR